MRHSILVPLVPGILLGMAVSLLFFIMIPQSRDWGIGSKSLMQGLIFGVSLGLCIYVARSFGWVGGRPPRDGSIS